MCEFGGSVPRQTEGMTCLPFTCQDPCVCIARMHRNLDRLVGGSTFRRERA